MRLINLLFSDRILNAPERGKIGVYRVVQLVERNDGSSAAKE